MGFRTTRKRSVQLQTVPEGPVQEEEALGKAYDARLMRRLLAYLRPYRWHVATAVVILIAASGLALVGPWLTKLRWPGRYHQAIRLRPNS